MHTEEEAEKLWGLITGAAFGFLVGLYGPFGG